MVARKHFHTDTRDHWQANANSLHQSLNDVLQTLKKDGPGIRMLGRDGVLRRLNGARETVVDYVPLSASHIAEFTKRYPAEARDMWAGIDGRAVMDEAQLWTVPDDILPRDPTAMTSNLNVKKALFEEVEAMACRNYACEDDDECQHEYNCAECDVFYECFGGPTGCSRVTRCDDTLG